MRISTLALAIALALGAPLAQAKAAGGAVRPVLTVSVEQPKMQEITARVSAYGGVHPWQDVAVSSEIGGLKITKLTAEVGDLVKKGQVLAQLNDEDVQATLAVQKAALEEAQANLEQARANADRARALGPGGAMSQQDYTAVLTGEKTAKAKVAALKAQVASQQIRLKNTRIVALDEGVVSSKSATLGQVVSAGTELFKLVRQNRLEWRAEVDAAKLARIKPGMAVLIEVGGMKLTSTVRKVSPSVDGATRTGLVYTDLPAADLKPGMALHGEVLVDKKPMLTVPTSAVVLKDGVSYVLTVDRNSKVVANKVVVGAKEKGVAAVSGVSESDKVIVSGGAFLAAGDLVAVEGKQ